MAAAQKDQQTFVGFEPHGLVIFNQIINTPMVVQKEGTTCIFKWRIAGNRTGQADFRSQVAGSAQFADTVGGNVGQSLSGCFRHADGAGCRSDLATVSCNIQVVTAVDTGMVIQCQKLRDLAGMVKVAMTQYQCICLFQVNIQTLGVG